MIIGAQKEVPMRDRILAAIAADLTAMLEFTPE